MKMSVHSVDLADPDKIESIMKDDPSILEPLYWVLEDAIHDNNLRLARCIYKDFLYFAHYRKEDLVRAMQPAYLGRLKVLAHELFSDTSIKDRKPIILKMASQSQQLPFQKEADFRDFLATNPRLLSDALHDQIRIIDTEVLTEDDYRCDILAESRTHYYPIELKIRQANHAVVSQIAKYCYCFYRRFRYGFHRPIQGVVIAAGFDAWSINELRREGIWIFDIHPDGDSIKLIRIP